MSDFTGPPPFEFWDRVQGHLGAYCHAATGTNWSAAHEDFDNPAAIPGYCGDLRIVTDVNIDGVPAMDVAAAAARAPGDAGVVSVLSKGTRGWIFEMQSNTSFVGDQDYVISAKVLITNRVLLDPIDDNGFRIGAGVERDAFNVSYPAFLAGGDKTTWHISCPRESGGPAVVTDTGVVIEDLGTTLPFAPWYVLTISRVGYALRFFINGKLIRIGGLEGVYLEDYPHEVRRYLLTRAFHPGALGTGFYMDYFHRLCRR